VLYIAVIYIVVKMNCCVQDKCGKISLEGDNVQTNMYIIPKYPQVGNIVLKASVFRIVTGYSKDICFYWQMSERVRFPERSQKVNHFMSDYIR